MNGKVRLDLKKLIAIIFDGTEKRGYVLLPLPLLQKPPCRCTLALSAAVLTHGRPTRLNEGARGFYSRDTPEGRNYPTLESRACMGCHRQWAEPPTAGFCLWRGFFLVFADFMPHYQYPCAALMGIGSHFVFTHDSIFVGEDGPTPSAC